MTIKRILILLLAVISISLTTNAQTLSKERKAKYEAKKSTQKKLVKQKDKKTLKLAKKLRAHPLTDAGTIIADETASTDMVYKEYLPKASTPAPTTVSTIPSSGFMIFGSPSVGLGVLTVQKSLTGWQSVGTISPSVSYTFAFAEYSTNADLSLNIQPIVAPGAFASIGYIPQLNLPSLQIGGSLGIYKYITAAVGYDVLIKQPFFAIGGTFSISNYHQGSGGTIFHTF